MAFTLITSDIHLNDNQPEITERFMYFLNEIAPQADKLYVIGDLFEVWIGDDEQAPLQQTIARAFKNLNHKHGVSIAFIRGNRDLLLGHHFAQKANLELLPNEQVVDLYNQPWLMMHGDQLCTLDPSYQRYRNIVLRPWVQRLFLSLPLRWRQSLARRLRQNSQKSTQAKNDTCLDVCLDTVQAYCDYYQVKGLIHGHTHRGALHLTETSYPRLVLNDWDQQGNYIWFNDRNEYNLVYF